MAQMRHSFLPFALPSIDEDEVNEVADSLRSGWLTTGPKVKRFEANFAEAVKCHHAVAVNSCTAALHLSMQAMGVGPGDEVIVPTMTFCSTANVVVHLGAYPVLVDVRSDMNVDPAAIEAAITPRSKLIVAVHHGGLPADMDAIVRIADRHGLPVIEDGAHAIGASHRGRPIGSIARTTSFSFYAIKNMTTGEGGMVTTDDAEVAARIRLLALHGLSNDAWKRYGSEGSWYYEVLEAGYKQNMTDIQASLGIHQLRKLGGFIEARRKIAAAYTEAFRDIEEVDTPIEPAEHVHAWHLYVIRLRLERLRISRAAVIDELRARNIGTSVHFIPVHLHPYYRNSLGYTKGALPISEDLYERIISLPLYPRMSAEDTNDVIQAVVDIVRENRR
jgi:dTDP-4-amino-4,6-dideoxygalactose transaminase